MEIHNGDPEHGGTDRIEQKGCPQVARPVAGCSLNHYQVCATTAEERALTTPDPATSSVSPPASLSASLPTFPPAPTPPLQPPPRRLARATTDDTPHTASPGFPAGSILRAVAARCDELRETASAHIPAPGNGAGPAPVLPGVHEARSSSCFAHRVRRQQRRSAFFRYQPAPALAPRHRSGRSSVLSLCFRGRGSAPAAG